MRDAVTAPFDAGITMASPSTQLAYPSAKGSSRMLVVALACGLVAALRGVAAADAPRLPLRLRATLGGGAMVSGDQTGRLQYDSLGLLGDLQLGYVIEPWLDIQLGVAGGGFPAPDRTGGLLAPMLGATLGLPSDGFRPFLALDLGPGFTGGLARPLLRADVGVELRVTNALRLGPIIGYGQLCQKNTPHASTDARFLWFGLVVFVQPLAASSTPPRQHQTIIDSSVLRVHERTTTGSAPPAALSEQLQSLLDYAVPSQHVELLAPVLFQFDSAELEPVGVAMLHEVASELERRPDILLLEVRGYADSRGRAEHNLELSERRALRVIEWLVEHGVAREHLKLAPRGAADFVESGSSEADHEQNRRVVFRVLEPGKD